MADKKDNRKKIDYLRLVISVFRENNCAKNNIIYRIYDLKIEKCYYILYEKEVRDMKKRVVALGLLETVLMGTVIGCGTTGNADNIDVKDSDGQYHVEVDFKADEVTLACTIDTPDADGEGTVENGTAEYWTVLIRACNKEQDPAIDFDRISYNTAYTMSKDFEKLFEKFWTKYCVRDDGMGMMEENKDGDLSGSDAETLCRILAFGELWDENPKLFPTERPDAEDGTDGAYEIAVMYEGEEEAYKTADQDKDGYISAQEFVKFEISSYENIIDGTKGM